MQTARIEEQKPGHLVVCGELSFEVANELQAEGETMIEQGPETCLVDMEKVRKVNSVGITLLLAWTRCAERASKNISFINMPNRVISIARISGVDTIVPMACDIADGPLIESAFCPIPEA